MAPFYGEAWYGFWNLFRALLSVHSIIGLGLYVLTSLAIYTIAKRRGIRNYGLAWVPFANVWILGSLSDQYKYVTAEKVQRRRVLLLWLSIGLAVLVCVAFGVILGRFIPMFLGGEAVVKVVLQAVTSAAFASLAIFALSIWYAVYCFIVLYNVYASCDPNNATLYLVLSILVSVTTPFFLFACRNKDDGMPPRFAQEAQPEPREPWEN